MPSTSPLGSAVAVEGLLLQIGNGQSPESYTTIANVMDVTLPTKADVQDVTNVGDSWRRRIATLLDMGTIAFTIFWVMTETTHWNQDARGLRYLMTNRIKRSYQLLYPNGEGSTDTFDAWVTSFSITGKVGDVFRATVNLANDNAPVLV